MRRRGFTLVELLVVIGIIALLISILLPSLSRAREAAKMISCASQMRQIYQFYSLYAVDYNGFYPALSGYHGWAGQVPSDFDQTGDGVEVMQRYQVNDPNAQKQRLWLCPSDFEMNHKPYDPTTWDAGMDLRQVSYGQNVVAWKAQYPTMPWQTENRDRKALKPGRIHSTKFGWGTAEMIMLAEQWKFGGVFYQNQIWQNSGLVEGGRTTDPPPNGWDLLLYRHYSDFSAMNCLYFDGHVDAVSYKDCQTAFVSLLTWPNPYDNQ